MDRFLYKCGKMVTLWTFWICVVGVVFALVKLFNGADWSRQMDTLMPSLIGIGLLANILDR